MADRGVALRSRHAPVQTCLAVFGLVVLSLSACAFPWGDSGPKLDPRDGAFAPVTIAPTNDGVQWGVPLEGGPIRALFIAPRFALRDAAALARRIDLRADCVALWDATHLGQPAPNERAIPGTSEEETLADLRDKLDRKVDVIVAANFDFGVLPQDAFHLLADKVRSGAGLVLAHHRHTLPDSLKGFLDELEPDPAGAIVTHGIGEQLTAEWKSGLGFVQCGTIGAGRVVEMDYQDDFPQTHCLIPALVNPSLAEPEDFDAYLSLAARALRWAAGRDVAVTVANVRAKPAPRPEDVQIPPGLETMVDANLPAGVTMFHPFELELSAPADRTYIVRTGVRQRGRGQAPVTIAQTRDPLRKGAQSHEFYVVAGAGEYWLDVWLLDDGKVAEWYSQAIAIDTWPSIADLALSKPSVLPQDSVGITFTMPARERPCIAFARATDPFGRLVAERHQPVPPDTAIVKIGLGLADLLGGIVKVEVFVSDRDLPQMPEWDTRICAYAYKYLPVRAPTPADTFEIVAASGAPNEFNARANFRGLSKIGITTTALPAAEESLRTAQWLGLRTIPIVTSYQSHPSPAPATARVPCLNDPAFIESEQAYLKGMAQIVRDYAAPAVSLGDDNALTIASDDVCRCPNCLAGFREYLRKRYADLAAMDRAWGASYETWDAIAPPTLQEARAASRYAPWIDFRLYMDSVFLNAHTAARAVVRTVDTRARCGLTTNNGYPELYAGHDWAALASQLDLVATRPDLRVLDIVRSSRGAASLAGIEVLADAQPDGLRWYPWCAVLHRAQSVWWPDITAGTANVRGVVGVDSLGNSVPFAPEFFAESAALGSGLARLWLKSKPLHADVAIYTGRASAWLNEIDNQFGASSAESEAAFAGALRALGYAFDFVTPSRVEKDALSGYRALVLPMARALGDAEVTAIRSFAAAGGCVITDVAPGAFDEHGVARESPPLAEVFGVRYAKASAAGGAAPALVELTIADSRA
ncbi:MAG: hypothetical protein FJY92_00355, partial [Candidatus Hydrogenedentes bacterium]|nr:hypothetical protein [Candidatus Hydrogenedentota bacterium]